MEKKIYRFRVLIELRKTVFWKKDEPTAFQVVLKWIQVQHELHS